MANQPEASTRTIGPRPDWRVEPGLTDYDSAVAEMETRAAAIASGEASEQVWLVEHPPLYTAGTSARPADLLEPRFPVHVTGRGGQYTYHGPGQRVVYLSLDLSARSRDIRRFVLALENWVIASLGDFGLDCWTVPGRIGIWTTDAEGREAKIGAIGVRVRKWVTMHGLSINVAPDLSHYAGIVPCGISDLGVTSLASLGFRISMAEVDAALESRLPLMLDAIA